MGGETGIRTPEGLASLTVFKTAAFNHSAISPIIKEQFNIRISLTVFPYRISLRSIRPPHFVREQKVITNFSICDNLFNLRHLRAISLKIIAF